MRIGLLGAGRIGAFHAGTLAAHPDVAELLVVDADPVRAAQVAADHGGRAVAVDALFRARPDAVVIASATATHAALLARAAEKGVPAFCEKPLSRDLAGTLAAVDAAETAGAVWQMGFQRRFDPEYAAARAAVLGGAVGRLHTVRTVTSDAAPPPAAYVPLSGGLYRDCLIHDFDVLRWVTGLEVTEVYATGANVGADYFRAAGDVDTGAALLTLTGGVLATVTATRYHAAGYDVRMELAGTDGQLGVGTGPRTPLSPAGAWAGAGVGAGGGPAEVSADGGPAEVSADGGPAEVSAGGDALGLNASEAGADASGVNAGASSAGGAGDGRAETGRRPGPWTGFLDRFAPAYAAELDTFLRVARGEAANPCTPREALRALLVAEACERSRREHRPVAVAEVEEAALARVAEPPGRKREAARWW
jgi:myo-inositol 2-dehydrogenase/D-chiro-inositol 1-dehydrogenase